MVSNREPHVWKQVEARVLTVRVCNYSLPLTVMFLSTDMYFFPHSGNNHFLLNFLYGFSTNFS